MNKLLKIHSPLNGTVEKLDNVPDQVFSERVLGDGCAVIPTDGKIYSPVDGEISSIAETNHAYGFSSDDGLEILVHFGLETVALKGEGFKPLVAVGDKVKKGDLVSEVDIALLKEKLIIGEKNLTGMLPQSEQFLIMRCILECLSMENTVTSP